MSAMGLPSDFVRKVLLLRSGYVWELAAASYPHIHCGGGDFPCIAGGGCGGRRLTWRRRGCGCLGQWPGLPGSLLLNCRPRHLHHPTGRPGWCRSLWRSWLCR